MEKRFSEFVLVAENAEAVRGARVDTAREGSYQLLGDVLTRFSDHCTNTGKRRRRKGADSFYFDIALVPGGGRHCSLLLFNLYSNSPQ